MRFIYRHLVIGFVLFFIVTACNRKTDLKDENFGRKEEFEIDGLKMSILLPNGWTRSSADGLPTFVQDCADTVQFCPSIVVVSVSVSELTPLDTVASEFASSISQKYEKSRVVRISTGNLRDVPMIGIDFKMKQNEIPVGGTTLFIRHQTKVISLNFMAGDNQKGEYKDNRLKFIKIVDSFEVNSSAR